MSELTLVFKTGSTTFEGFGIASLKVKSKHSYTSESGGSCGCSEYRVTEGCAVSDFLKSPVRHVYRNGRFEEVEERMFSDADETQWIGIAATPSSPAAVVDPFSPDVSISSLLVSMKTGNDMSDKADRGYSKEEGPFIQPDLLRKQCLASIVNDVLVVDDAVHRDQIEFDEVMPANVRGFEISDEDFVIDETDEVFQRTDINDAWKSVARPNPKQFYVSEEDWQTLIFSMMNGKNILLTGPSGSGKSELVYLAAKACGMEDSFEAFNMGAMSEPRTSLIGATHFDDARGTWFNQSRFVRTVSKDDSVVLLDEITRCDRAAFNILLPLMDRQGYLALDESEDASVIHKAKNVSFIATANVGSEYTGTDEMDQALRNRFSAIIDVAFPPMESEIAILRSRTGIPFAPAKRLCELAHRQRQMTVEEGDFMTQISTRMLIEAAEKIAAGFDFATACKFAIENHFSAEGGMDDSERIRIRQIIQKNDG